MNDELILTVTAEEAGARLDAYLASATELTRSAAARLMEEEQVTLNGKRANKKDKVKAGDVIIVLLPEPEPDEAIPQDIPLDIVYEDEDILVVNKPCGMVVHPAAGNPDGTLVNAILYHCGDSLSGIGGVIRPGIVHRIDKDTSGLLVVAKNDAAHLALSEQLKVHRVRRVYHAIAIGNLREDMVTVDAPIGRHPTDRKKMAVLRGADAHARDAVTHYRMLERFAGMCHVECRLETGRTHQIRVHMASLGHPLLGDPVYGGANHKFCENHPALIHGQCLHAAELSLIHPRSGEEMHFTCPLPEDMERILELLRRA
ncbi:MAG: RluA family pseudouridine synthase [Clostridia bacterium]|nr:RluA family pseudouridine synthase [Clostridia bacterium]